MQNKNTLRTIFWVPNNEPEYDLIFDWVRQTVVLPGPPPDYASIYYDFTPAIAWMRLIRPGTELRFPKSVYTMMREILLNRIINLSFIATRSRILADLRDNIDNLEQPFVTMGEESYFPGSLYSISSDNEKNLRPTIIFFKSDKKRPDGCPVIKIVPHPAKKIDLLLEERRAALIKQAYEDDPEDFCHITPRGRRYVLECHEDSKEIDLDRLPAPPKKARREPLPPLLNEMFDETLKSN